MLGGGAYASRRAWWGEKSESEPRGEEREDICRGVRADVRLYAQLLLKVFALPERSQCVLDILHPRIVFLKLLVVLAARDLNGVDRVVDVLVQVGGSVDEFVACGCERGFELGEALEGVVEFGLEVGWGGWVVDDVMKFFRALVEASDHVPPGPDASCKDEECGAEPGERVSA